MLYLDHAASTPIDLAVLDTFVQVMRDYPGNPSAAHQLGQEARQLLELSIQQMASLLKVSEQELICTSGGSESNTLAIRGAAMANRHRGNHLVTTTMEHQSLQAVFSELERAGFAVTYVPVNRSGVVDVADLQKALRADTILVSVIHVQSEIGTIQPVEAIGQMLRKQPQRVLFHVDAAQSVSKLPVEIERSAIDLLSASAHKWYGPRGVGLLYCRTGVELLPLIAGGGQQNGMRGGTEQVAAVAAMAKALRLFSIDAKTNVARMQRLYELRRYWQMKITQFTAVARNGRDCARAVLTGEMNEQQSAPHIVHFRLPGYRAEVVVRALSALGIYVSSQSACSTRRGGASRILQAIGLSERDARTGIRVSYDADLQEQQIDLFFEKLTDVLRDISRIQRA